MQANTKRRYILFYRFYLFAHSKAADANIVNFVKKSDCIVDLLVLNRFQIYLHCTQVMQLSSIFFRTI